MIGKLVDARGKTVLVLNDNREWTGPEQVLASALVPAAEWSPADGHPAGMLYLARQRLYRPDLVVVLDPRVEADLRTPAPEGVVY